ncbi:MAG: AlwI family type II restriction endonuclease [Gammaproteobacteria bacterium]
MLKPWAISIASGNPYTVRSPDKLRGFLSVLAQMEGEEWDDKSREEFQIRLIQSILLLPCNFAPAPADIRFLAKGKGFSYRRAKTIFQNRNYANPSMRARRLFNSLQMFGFVFLENEKICITELGRAFLAEKKDYGNIFLPVLLNWQIPNPLDRRFPAGQGYNIKPFVGAVRLIRAVDSMSSAQGISLSEFAVFGLTLINYRDIEKTATEIISFRRRLKETASTSRRRFIQTAAARFRPGFDMRQAEKIADEFALALVMTQWIAAGEYDGRRRLILPFWKMAEINAVLASDSGAPETFFSTREYTDYIGKINYSPRRLAA